MLVSMVKLRINFLQRETMLNIDCVIIPARGGSKRIKNKNLTLFLGKSMLERSIEIAQQVSKYVIVSSDNEHILNVAKQNGAYPFTRNQELANDFTQTLPVIANALYPMLHNNALQHLESLQKENKDFNKQAQILDYTTITQTQLNYIKANISLQLTLESKILCLYPTAMFASKDSISQAYQILENNPSLAYVVSALQNDKIWRGFYMNNENINFLFPNFMQTRSQDLTPAFNDAGQFYLGFAKSFLYGIPILGNQSGIVVLDKAWDIDTMLDLKIAELLFQASKDSTI